MAPIFVGLCYHPCMFMRIKSTPNSPRKSVQIVASVRDGNKVRQKIMRHVGVAQNDAELAQLKELAEFIKTQMEEEHQPQLFPADEVAKQVIAAKKMGTTRDEEWRIQLRSATLLLRSLNQFSKDGLRLLEAKAFPRSQVQPPFYPGYKLIADRSHIGSLRDVLPEQPVKVLIQPALPRRIGMGKVKLDTQCFTNFLVLNKL